MYGPGALLANRYRLDERVGGGGMGEVWRATDLVLDRIVAVKVMRPELLEEPGFADRFLVEARTMATIRHPGVVGVHDYRSEATGAFLVMEFVAGESLSRQLYRLGRLDPTRTMTLVAQAADALQAAHDRGVVHRDIKPGNLLVTVDNQLVLTDFGIARSAASTALTATGAVIGTPSYLAPEQVLGKGATVRSDVYALGVVAYECLTGQRPFEGDNPFDIAMKRLREPPPTLAVDAPPAVLAVVERALAADPEQRWPSATELAAAARRAVAGEPPPAAEAAPAETAPAEAAPAAEPAEPPGPGMPRFAPARVAVPGPSQPLPPTRLEPPAAAAPQPPARRPQSPPPDRRSRTTRPQQSSQPSPVPAGWPMPVARPPTVFVANLLLRVAAICLFIYCVGSVSVLDVITTESERSFGDDGEGVAGLVALLGWLVIAALLLVGLLLLLLAGLNHRRSRAARAWTFVVGFFVLCCCAPLGLLSNAGSGTEVDQTEYERRLAAALPAWYEPLTGATGLILVGSLLTAMVLLVLPPANRFFRVPPQPVIYYPYYPYPPGR